MAVWRLERVLVRLDESLFVVLLAFIETDLFVFDNFKVAKACFNTCLFEAVESVFVGVDLERTIVEHLLHRIAGPEIDLSSFAQREFCWLSVSDKERRPGSVSCDIVELCLLKMPI